MTCTRGTSNGNQRGSSYSRAVRRAWLLSTYAANVQVIRYTLKSGHVADYHPSYPEDQANMVARFGPDGNGSSIDWAHQVMEYVALATCRCYRCGCLLVDGTLTVDRIIPGVKGGTYRRNNIRPACGLCNSETGGPLAQTKKKAGKK